LFLIEMERPPQGGEEVLEVDVARATISEVGRMRDLARLGDRLADAASRRRSQPLAAEWPRAAFVTFVGSLIEHYVRNYGVRPAASPNGYFGKALETILRLECIPAIIDGRERARPSERWLSMRIKEVAGGAPAPKRGKKSP
jgi:hypothetical protein